MEEKKPAEEKIETKPEEFDLAKEIEECEGQMKTENDFNISS